MCENLFNWATSQGAHTAMTSYQQKKEAWNFTPKSERCWVETHCRLGYREWSQQDSGLMLESEEMKTSNVSVSCHRNRHSRVTSDSREVFFFFCWCLSFALFYRSRIRDWAVSHMAEGEQSRVKWGEEWEEEKKGVKIQFKNQGRRAMCRAEQTDVTEWNIVWIKISTTQFNSSDCYSRTLYSIESETERREKFFIKFSPILPFSHRHIVRVAGWLYIVLFSHSFVIIIITAPLLPLLMIRCTLIWLALFADPRAWDLAW